MIIERDDINKHLGPVLLYKYCTGLHLCFEGALGLLDLLDKARGWDQFPSDLSESSISFD